MSDPLEVILQLGDEEMPDSISATTNEILLTQILQVGKVSHENLTKVIHYTDTDYLEGRRVIGLTEAVGVREVQSKETPGGPANANRA